MSEKPFGKDYQGRDVFLAETNKVEARKRSISRLLAIISPYMEWPDRGRHVFVSDMSELSDFGLSPKELREISAELGFKVADHDYLYEIAERMGDEREA